MRRRRRRTLGSGSEPPAPPSAPGSEVPAPAADEPSTGATAVDAAPGDPRVDAAGDGAAANEVVTSGRTDAEASTERSTPPQRPRKAGRLWRVLRIVAGVLVLLGVVAALGLYLVIQRYSRDLPSVETLKRDYEPPQITRIFARDQTLLASVFAERRTVVPFEHVPDAAKLAFLAAEDAHFYEHEGLNYLGILRAFVANVRAGHMVQGGSTITQQVIKNVLLGGERSLERKIREVLLVHRLEQSLSKDEIFWLYLNHIYLGHGRYGIEEASRFYFGKPANHLALDEAATLAGLIASPENYSPRRDPEKSLKRRAYVLDQMLKKGFVTRELYDATRAAPLRLSPAEETESRLAPEMIERARKLLGEIAPEQAHRGGFSLTTTIDPRLQAVARQALRGAIDAYMERHGLFPPFTAPSRKLWPEPFVGTPKPFRIYTGLVQSTDDQAGTIDVRVGDLVGRVSLAAESRYNPKRLKPSEFAKPGAALRVSLPEEPRGEGNPVLRLQLGPQGALAAIDVRTRDVLALVGSYEGVSGDLDRATQSRRQPGSAFKPIVFSHALHSRRWTPASVVPVTQRKQGVSAEGPLAIGLRDAVAHSNNEVATLVLKDIGAPAVVDWAAALGIEARLEPDLSLALGAYEVGVLELTNAYVAFANGGHAGVPRFLSKVTNPEGHELPLPALPPERRVLGADEAYLTTSLLRSVIQYGTGTAARALGREAAGKTGTTNDAKDAWFVGYTPDLVCGVWIGYDDALPLGPKESGARTALPAWTEFMKAAHEALPKMTFTRTAGVLSVAVDPATGLLPAPAQTSTRHEEFLAGTEPSEVAPFDAGAPEPAPSVTATSASSGPEPELPPF